MSGNQGPLHSADTERSRQQLLELLPRSTPFRERLDIVARSETARFVGGDFYDFYKVNDNQLAVIMADVSAQGSSATHHAALVKSIFHELAPLGLTAHEFAARANAAVCERFERGIFVTALIALVTMDASTVTFVRCGHCYPLLWHASTGKVITVISEGMGLGILPEGGSHIEQACFRLRKGDAVLLYTDGLIEARNSAGEEYGIGRLRRLFRAEVQAGSDDLARSILDEIRRFSPDPVDDRSVMALKWASSAI